MELPEEAARILAAKGLEPSKYWADVWRSEHAVAFSVAQMVRADQLLDVQQALAQSLKEGTTKRQFVAELAPLLERKGWKPKGRGGDIPYRLARIYDINRRTARAAGQWSRIQRTKRSAPYLLYLNGPSKRHRADHVQWAGTCLSADHKWWDTHFPPNGWGCKCFVRQIDGAERGRLGKERKIRTEAPPSERVRWVSRKTGEVRTVAKGVDPSWDYNVGKAPWEGIARGTEKTANALYSAAGAASAKKWVGGFQRGPGFRRYIEELKINRGEAGVPGAVLPKKVAAKGSSPVLLLDVKPVRKQLRRRKQQYEGSGENFEWTEYHKLQSLVENAEIIAVREADGVRRTVAAARDDAGKGYAIVWEATHGRNVLVTFFRPGEGIAARESFEDWVKRQRKMKTRKDRRGRPQHPSD